jgi:tetratricopeptide (TPR) repeat protein
MSRHDLVDRLLEIQSERWHAGTPTPAEEFLADPALQSADPAELLVLAFNEYRLRCALGIPPDEKAFLQRFARFAPELGEILQIHSGLVTSLDTRPDASATQEAPRPRALACPGAPDLAGYEILEELGRGGTGVVFKARQVALQRIVALKMLLSGHAGHPERKRFQVGAEAMARLTHPNIVPVFEVGEHNGPPLFSMEYCPGGTLAGRLAGTPLPPATAALLVRTLAAAMHAAHQANVIHRDLKPANVLVVEPSSTPLERCTLKITDFGLAKRLEADSGQTRSGSILGTPSYMAPEQAEGRAHEVGPPADIYALGAILYELLTGRVPFRAPTLLETLEQVRSREPVAPTELQPRVPRDLETICLKCLEKDPKKRYTTAQDLADDLRRFRAGEAIKARRTSAWERAWKWGKRRPAPAALMAVSVSAALILSVLGGVAFYQWRTAEAALLSKQESLERAEEAEKAATANWQLAEKAVDECFNVAKEDPLFQAPRMEKARKLLLAKTLPFYRHFRDQRPGDGTLPLLEAEQWFRVGYIEAVLGKTTQAREAYEKARRLYRERVENDPQAADHQEKLARTLNNLANLLVRLGKHEEALTEYQQACKLQGELVQAHPRVDGYREYLARTHNNLGNLLNTLGRRGQALEEYRQAHDLQAALVKAQPGVPTYQRELGRTHSNRGWLLVELGKGQEALKEYQQARDIAGKLVKAHPGVPEYQSDLAIAHNNLGPLLATLGQREAALKEYRQAHDLQFQLVKAHPDVPKFQHGLAVTNNNLGLVLEALGKRDQALTTYQQARDLCGGLVGAHPNEPNYQKELARAHHNLGLLLASLGKREEALRQYQKAHTIQHHLVETQPGVSRYQDDLARTHNNTGLLLKELGKRPQALKEFAQVRDILRRLIKADPGVPGYRNDLATTHNNVGRLLSDLGRREPALAEYQQARDLLRQLVKDHPNEPRYRSNLAGSHGLLGRLLSDLGRREPALAEYQQARDLLRQLVKDHPNEPRYRNNLADACLNCGWLLVRLNHLPASLPEFDEGITLADRLLRIDARNSGASTSLLFGLCRRASVLSLLGKQNEADADWDRAVKLASPELRPALRLERAERLARAGHYRRAASEADLLERHEAPPAPGLYILGRIFALNAASAARDVTRPLPEREKRAEEYARRAVAVLNRAASAGYFRNSNDAALLDRDADLTFLRDRDDYKRFRAGLPLPR